MTEQMPKTALIHVWQGGADTYLKKAVKNCYKAVLSSGFYIDLLLSASAHYRTSLYPANISDEAKHRILGGEATMWSELVTPVTIDSRIWQRSISIGECLWTNPEKVDTYKISRVC